MASNEVRGSFSYRRGSGPWSDSPVTPKPNHFGTSIPRPIGNQLDPDSCPLCGHYEFWTKAYSKRDHIKDCSAFLIFIDPEDDTDRAISDNYYSACAGTYPDSGSPIGERFVSAIQNDETGHFQERFANDYDNGVKH